MNKVFDLDSMTELPNRDDHNCFGCSPSNSSGLRMRFFTDTEKVYSRVVVPPHLCGWDTMAHGGVISTILDEIMSWSAIYLTRRLILTKTMTVDFIRPVLIEQELRVVGTVLERTGEREAVMEGKIFNSRDELCARSRGTFALFTPEAIRKMGILSEKAVEDIEYIMNGDAGDVFPSPPQG